MEIELTSQHLYPHPNLVLVYWVLLVVCSLACLDFWAHTFPINKINTSNLFSFITTNKAKTVRHYHDLLVVVVYWKVTKFSNFCAIEKYTDKLITKLAVLEMFEPEKKIIIIKNYRFRDALIVAFYALLIESHSAVNARKLQFAK